MPNYRRTLIPGGTYFFTIVTHERRPWLILPHAREILRAAVIETRKRLPFTIHAWVLLPEHIHCLWTLPEGDQDFSKRWALIKRSVSKHACHLVTREGGVEHHVRQRHRENPLWQQRFWEHAVRNDEDFKAHMDYVHYNPLRHGLVERVEDWPYSTFHRYVREGFYPRDWGNAPVLPEGKYGE